MVAQKVWGVNFFFFAIMLSGTYLSASMSPNISFFSSSGSQFSVKFKLLKNAFNLIQKT